jgi:proteasome assembly chaperone (PAC2) family protein
MKFEIKKYGKTPRFNQPIVVLGSPGLSSVGKMAIDFLVDKIQPQLFLEVYSSNFPVIHIGPSHFAVEGYGGVKVREGMVEFPKISFYHCEIPELIFVDGYQADFNAQFGAAFQVAGMFPKWKVKRMYVLASHGGGKEKLYFAATNPSLCEEMKQLGIKTRETGGFYGFSGLVMGMGAYHDVDGICLFAKTKVDEEDLERPDPNATKVLLDFLKNLIGLDLDTSDLDVGKAKSEIHIKEHPKEDPPGYQ